jgi:hypothetical protein
MYSKPQGLLQALEKVRKADAAETTMKKTQGLLQALEKVRKTDVAETTMKKPNRLQ